MTTDIPFWDKQIETIDPAGLQALQLERLKETAARALNTQFYRRRFKEAGIESADYIADLEDIRRLPFTTKDDLRENYPYGMLAVDKKDVVRVHASSGTTGLPTVIFHTARDIDTWANLVARSIRATGVSRDDVFQNMMTYGLFTGGLGLHYGAERIGMMVIPIGGGNTKRQILFMKDFKTTVLHITPSYALHLYDCLKEEGISVSELSLRKAFLGAEPYSENTRRKVEQMYSIDVYNSYGLSEMNGPGVAFECVFKDGMHIWEDAFIVEVVDPHTLEPVEDGQEGELVLTTITREAMPIIRYRTKDLTRIIPGRCACGRTHRRIARITGRTDDMLIINGVNMFPSQIEEVLMKIPEVGTNYQICVYKKGNLDSLVVRVELYSKMFSGDINQLDNLKGRIKDELRASIVINPNVELLEPGSLPAFEGKGKRVFDYRQKDV